MMSKMKSLSDSSTSESEDDYSKRFQQKSMSYVPWTATKRSLSTDDTEDEHQTDSVMTANKSASSFKSPNKYSERSFSTDDTEDEHLEMVPPAKKFKSDFKNPSQYVERDLSDSESDDKNSFVKTGEGIANMPSIETFNGSYGVGMKMMEKMGYKTGTGLGKFEQGRVNIVEASKQRGRRGLGLHIEGLEPSDVKWDSAKEEISLEEEIVWIPECDAEPLKISQMRNWMLEGPKKIDISSETEFCDPEILRDIISYKSVFDKLEPEEMRKARTRSNPFETIRGCIFLNRAAMKMANMDAAFDFMFSNPKDKNGRSLVVGNELLYFADICAGPGGFSEYILWRKKWECKGFGFTLKG
ncbi:Cap-specific mRNA (nucleoside-2'-O-)-methyltransferase 1, partial [Stegodyphus mimosarum]